MVTVLPLPLGPGGPAGPAGPAGPQGQQGVQGAGAHPKTEAQKARQRSFKARHAKNIAKGKMSAAYWADKVKW